MGWMGVATRTGTFWIMYHKMYLDSEKKKDWSPQFCYSRAFRVF